MFGSCLGSVMDDALANASVFTHDSLDVRSILAFLATLVSSTVNTVGGVVGTVGKIL